MKVVKQLACAFVIGTAALATSGCGTTSGAVVGGVTGAAVGGSTAATVGGAVVGGVIGHELNKDK